MQNTKYNFSTLLFIQTRKSLLFLSDFLKFFFLIYIEQNAGVSNSKRIDFSTPINGSRTHVKELNHFKGKEVYNFLFFDSFDNLVQYNKERCK